MCHFCPAGPAARQHWAAGASVEEGLIFAPILPAPLASHSSWEEDEANKCWTSLTEGDSQGHTEGGAAPQGVTELRTLSKGSQVVLTNAHISHELFIFSHDSLKYLGVGSLETLSRTHRRHERFL